MAEGIKAIVASPWEERVVESTPETCRDCGRKVGLAPSSVEIRKDNPGTYVVCTACWDPSGNTVVIGRKQRLEMLANFGPATLNAAVREAEARGTTVVFE